MSLIEVVCGNIDKVRKMHDLSTRELGARAGMPQKTVHSILNMTHIPRLDNIEQICKTLLIAPQAVVTPHLPMEMLMSRRVGRLVESYAKLSMDQRDKVDELIDSFGE